LVEPESPTSVYSVVTLGEIMCILLGGSIGGLCACVVPYAARIVRCAAMNAAPPHTCDRKGPPETVIDASGDEPVPRIYPTCSVCGKPQAFPPRSPAGDGGLDPLAGTRFEWAQEPPSGGPFLSERFGAEQFTTVCRVRTVVPAIRALSASRHFGSSACLADGDPPLAIRPLLESNGLVTVRSSARGRTRRGAHT